MKQLSEQEKLDFITRNGWIQDKNTSFGGRYRKQQWDVEYEQWLAEGRDPYQYLYCMRNHSLSTAYELEMEAEYDRVTELLKGAKRVISKSDCGVGGDVWLQQYEKWSKI